MRQRRAVVTSAAAAALAALAALLLAGCGAYVGPAHTTTTGAAVHPKPAPRLPTRPLSPKPAAPERVSRDAPQAFHVTRRTQLRLKPDGKMVATISTKTEFKSPTILAVAARKPGWVLVRTAVERHHVGWLPDSAGSFFTEPRTIVIDLSRRTLSVFHRGKLTDVYKVGIGTDATPTPRGKFAVTDRLKVPPGTDYGCCILALTAHQPKILQGWGGGDRVAIHATPHPETIGLKVSHGCVRSSNAALHQLMARVRLGTPVTIHL